MQLIFDQFESWPKEDLVQISISEVLTQNVYNYYNHHGQ